MPSLYVPEFIRKTWTPDLGNLKEDVKRLSRELRVSLYFQLGAIFIALFILLLTNAGLA